jgi:hypothetical protein
MFALVACGDSGTTTTIDAPPAVTQDCATYCSEITTNCTAGNAQYADAAHCMATCTSFPMGTAADKGPGQNTLGCRIYHAGAPSMATPATHCPHAGPAGDLVTVATNGQCGDACTSFCTLDIKVCGSTDAPVTGITPAYQNVAACMSACTNFDKTVAYSSTSTTGNNLACRLYHATNAATFAAAGNAATASTHCGHTASPATGQCL